MSNYIVKAQKAFLKTPLTASATSVVLRAFLDSKDNELALSDFGSYGVIVIKQGDTIEMIKFDGVTQDGSSTACTLTVATSGRNLDPTTPYAGSATGEAFQSGAECIITNDPLTVSKLGNLNNANTWALLQTFTVMPQSSDVPTEDEDLINKAYADALVLGTLTTINLIVPATAGETVTAGALVYYDTTDKEWKLCDANTASTVDNVMLAISQGAGTNGNAITGGVMLRGLDANQTGMTAGDIMYASDTAGEIANSAGTVEVTAGVAKSATQLYFNPRFNQQLTENEQDALAGTSGTPSSTNKYATADSLDAITPLLTPSGSLVIWTTDTAPTGYLLCYGQAVSRATYATLFGVISTGYGVGDGTTTFNVPDLRGRVALGQDDMGGSSADRVTNAQADTLGGVEGEESHVILTAEMPAHSHTYATGQPGAGTGGVLGGYTILGTLSTSSVGSNTAHNNVQPYITLNYIIKT